MARNVSIQEKTGKDKHITGNIGDLLVVAPVSWMESFPPNNNKKEIKEHIYSNI